MWTTSRERFSTARRLDESAKEKWSLLLGQANAEGVTMPALPSAFGHTRSTACRLRQLLSGVRNAWETLPRASHLSLRKPQASPSAVAKTPHCERSSTSSKSCRVT